MSNVKRLFLAFDVSSPWIDPMPKARMLCKEMRHLTMIFLGAVEPSEIETLWKKVPLPPFQVGLSGVFTKPIFLPHSHHHVVAFYPAFFRDVPLQEYFQTLKGVFDHDKKGFLPHVTVGRTPFDEKDWENTFTKIPLVLGDFHLYESLGNLTYQKICTHSIMAPFEPLSHTADLAFKIRGDSPRQLYESALAAMMFEDLNMVNTPPVSQEITSLDHVIKVLNRHLAFCDQHHGCLFKAVSYSGRICTLEYGILEWEMIVDV